jgi:hypothetical protein
LTVPPRVRKKKERAHDAGLLLGYDPETVDFFDPASWRDLDATAIGSQISRFLI